MRIALLALTGCSFISSGGLSTSPASPSSSARDMGRGEATAPTRQPLYLPVLDAPADPWTGVAGDAPATIDDSPTLQRLSAKAEDHPRPCTAARDHCLPALAWLWIHEGEVHLPVKDAHFAVFTPEGPISPSGYVQSADGFQAYRTVPATRANLVPGAIVATFRTPIPADPLDAFQTWRAGTVERVDWELGFIFFEGGQEPQFITSARVAVLSYATGRKVEILGARPRDQLAVRISDVILPDP
jgi:hypothetical protein